MNNCNTLALWSARAIRSLALDAFNAGDYYRAVEEEVESETVTKGALPERRARRRASSRLLQQHFFVSCSLQDILHLMADLAGRTSGRCPTGRPCSSTTRTRRSRWPS